MRRPPFFYVIALAGVASLFGASSRFLVPDTLAAPPSKIAEGGFLSDTVKRADYLWPTDAGRAVTSAFAEYRSGHFHGGIDISTHGHTGYKVFAARDGYVFRIRITPDGYGKMLYIRHGDGYVTAYAHLKTFSAAINAMARQEQYRRGTYEIDLMPDSGSHPVRRGELIAYTGDTGFGPPHLHFEIRDEGLNPVNPMVCAQFGITDRISPVIRRLLISPLTFNSTIDNSSSPKIIRRFRGRAHDRFVAHPLILHGTIGFAVDAVDRSEGTWSRSGIHRLEMYIDDSLAFAMKLDRVPVADTKEIDLDYDLPMKLQGWGKFQKLYIDTGNTLPFYGRMPEGTGIINTESLGEGEHDYRLVCRDFSGNQAAVKGTLIVNHRPLIRIKSVDEEDVVLVGSDLDLIQKCCVSGRKLSSPDWSQHTIVRGGFEADSTGIELPVDTKRYDVLKIWAETKMGSQTRPIFAVLHAPNEPPRTMNLKTEAFADYVRFTLTSTGLFTSAPRVSVREGDRTTALDAEASDLYKYSCAYAPSSGYAGPRSVSVQAGINGAETSASDEFSLFPIAANAGGSFTAEPWGLKFSYDSAAVYKPLFVQITSENYSSSTVYILDPQDRLLNRGVRVSVPAGPNPAGSRRGLFFRADGGWMLQTDRPDSGGGSFSTRLRRTLGELAVLTDNDPPTIGRLKVSARGRKASVRFHYHDDLSGVDTDELKMYIDDRQVIPEIDGEHHLVTYLSDERLQRGNHSLKITMKDRMKNALEVSRTFKAR
ncbi:MAG TPA: M23 family metallopeptidase [Bacteroidota bacterium]|nr:M23 family metallopeptidase [Bacteroidota bacterium]